LIIRDGQAEKPGAWYNAPIALARIAPAWYNASIHDRTFSAQVKTRRLQRSIVMAKQSTKNLDNLMRLIAALPADESERILKEVKREKDPEGKKRIIERALGRKGLKPL